MNWLTARELAGLPGMTTSERFTRDKLIRLGVPSRPRTGRVGGGLEYDCSALPAETRQALAINKVAQAGTTALALAEPAPVQSFAPPEKPLPDQLAPVPSRKPPSQADKSVADARVQLVNLVLELEPVHGVKRACAVLALQLASGQASADLQATARAANQRARGDMVSARTLERWLSQYRATGWWGLLPVAVEVAPVQEVEKDVAAVLGLFHSRDARFRKLTGAAKEVTRQLGRDFDTWTALYGRARRTLAKVDNVTLIKSRHSGAERAALLPYRRRDTTMLKPLDVWLIDGHTFKAKVRHPDHGAPFAPELTMVLDAHTRMICGWSVALSENVFAVGDALRHAIGQHGVPAVVYTDNGPGETAKPMDCPIHGFMARLGIDHRTGLPGHPQGHGLIERSWQTHAINCARTFGSYQGRDVDSGTFRKAAAELAKEQRAVRRAEETGEVVQLNTKAPSWQQFIDGVVKMVQEYNTQHRHRKLPKREDGKRMTPAEAWAASFDAELQHRPSELELRMLFMPAVVRTAKRGQVTFFNQHYQAPELMGMNVADREVSVRYDIHNPNFVLIYTLDGEYVCEAKWDANRIDYFPKPVIEMAREKRVKAAVKRREQQIDTALRELPGTHTASAPLSLLTPGMDNVLVPTVPTVEALAPAFQDVEPKVKAAAAAPSRPFFDALSERYEWLMRHQDQWNSEDSAWLSQYVASDDYEGLADYYAGRGLAWSETGEKPGFKSAQVSGASNT